MPITTEFAKRYTESAVYVNITKHDEYCTVTLRYKMRGLDVDRTQTFGNKRKALQGLKNILHTDKYISLQMRNDINSFIKTQE